MTLVVDASLTLAWYFDDESSPQADAVLDRVLTTGAIVPAVWRFEVASVFQVAIRRKRIDTAYRDRALRRLAQMKITVDAEGEAQAWTTVLHHFRHAEVDRIRCRLPGTRSAQELAARHPRPRSRIGCAGNRDIRCLDDDREHISSFQPSRVFSHHASWHRFVQGN